MSDSDWAPVGVAFAVVLLCIFVYAIYAVFTGEGTQQIVGCVVLALYVIGGFVAYYWWKKEERRDYIKQHVHATTQHPWSHSSAPQHVHAMAQHGWPHTRAPQSFI